MRAGASTPTRHMCVWFFFPFFILCLHPQMPLPPVCACNQPTLSIRLGSHVNDLDTSPPAACLQRGQQRVPGQVRAGVPQTATVWVLWFARTNQDGGVGVFLTLMSSCITFASVLSGLLDGCWMRARLPVWDLRVGVGRQCRGPSTSSHAAFQNSESEDGTVPLSQHAWGSTKHAWVTAPASGGTASKEHTACTGRTSSRRGPAQITCQLTPSNCCHSPSALAEPLAAGVATTAKCEPLPLPPNVTTISSSA